MPVGRNTDFRWIGYCKAQHAAFDEPSARANGGLTEETLIKLGEDYFLQIRSNPKQSRAAARPMTPMVTIHSMPVGQ